jgi:hypothetical protein
VGWLVEEISRVMRDSIESFRSRFPFSRATFEINDIWETIKNKIQPGQGCLTLGSEDPGRTNWIIAARRIFRKPSSVWKHLGQGIFTTSELGYCLQTLEEVLARMGILQAG